MVAGTMKVAGDEKLLDFRYSLQVAPSWFDQGLDVEIEKKRMASKIWAQQLERRLPVNATRIENKDGRELETSALSI